MLSCARYELTGLPDGNPSASDMHDKKAAWYGKIKL